MRSINRSNEDQINENQELTNHIYNALNSVDADGNRSQEGHNSINWLNDTLTKQRDDLRIDQRIAEREAKMPQPDVNSQAIQNKNNLISANPDKDVVGIYDSIFKDPTIDSFFQSLGIGPAEFVSSADRASASFELAQKVHLANNFDAAVDTAVKKQMESQRERGNAGSPGSQGSSKSATGKTAAINDEGIIQNTAEEFQYMSSGSF